MDTATKNPAPVATPKAEATAPDIHVPEMTIEVAGYGDSRKTVYGFHDNKKLWLDNLQGQKVPIGAKFQIRNATITHKVTSRGPFKAVSGDIKFLSLNNGAAAAAAAAGAWKNAQALSSNDDNGAI